MTKFLKPCDIAELLNVSYDSALAFIKYSGIDYVKIGRQYRVSEAKLNAFLGRQGTVIVETSEY